MRGGCEKRCLSLTELPLNVLFQIFCFLEREELINIARCCRILRILANESLMLTNNMVELQGFRNRRLLFDVFDILNGSRNLVMRLTMEYKVSILESVRYVQRRTQMMLLRDEETEEDVRNDGKMTYLKILQGFNNLALAAQDCTKSDEEVVTPSEDPVSYEPVVTETKIVSPAASNYSKSSAASIFSDLPPKLSNRGWHSSIYELEHVSDHTDASTSECDTSSSTDSIVRLRNSTKVKDKAALFEKLFSQDYEITKSPKKCRKNKSYGALSPTIRPASEKRSISQGYLEELERCSLATQNSSYDYDVDLNTLKDQDKKSKSARPRIFRRSKLTAFVTEDNKICYEKS
ncbi:hypothetical protein HG537_0G02050 [Torulaspora globosa]|uniref:F-box domain-containing protein n=1 Tax=Torulaspora globosa TaxID=48254 RepID=A0A7H9HX79_9SACH|nr:hypothetical protein HG537_0G02050 [Torulaspora sp. CBS 2947]